MQLAHEFICQKKQGEIILVTIMLYQLGYQRYQRIMKSLKDSQMCMVAQNKVICVHPNPLVRMDNSSTESKSTNKVIMLT